MSSLSLLFRDPSVYLKRKREPDPVSFTQLKKLSRYVLPPLAENDTLFGIKKLEQFKLADFKDKKKQEWLCRLETRLQISTNPLRDIGHSSGDQRLAKIRYYLNNLGEWKRSADQILFHEHFLVACLPHIYNKDWNANGARVMASMDIQHIDYEVLCQTPRRFGKTMAVAMFVAVLAALCPGIKISIFSTGSRASKSMVDHILQFIHLIPGAMRRKIKQSKEELMFSREWLGPKGGPGSLAARNAEHLPDTTVIKSYPASIDRMASSISLLANTLRSLSLVEQEQEIDLEREDLTLAELFDRKYGHEQAHTEAGPEKRGLGEDFKEKDREKNQEDNNNNNESKAEAKEEEKPKKKKKVKSDAVDGDKPQFTQNDNSSGRTYLVPFDPQETRMHRFDYYSDDDEAEINAIETDYKNMQNTEGMVARAKKAIKNKPAEMSAEKWYDQESSRLEKEVKMKADKTQRELFTVVKGKWPALKEDGIMNRRQGVSIAVIEKLKTLNVNHINAPQDSHSLENLTFLLRVTPFLMQLESELAYLDSYIELCRRGVEHLKWLMLLVDSDEGAALFQKAADLPLLMPYYNKLVDESDITEQTNITKEGYFAFVMEIYKMWSIMFQWKMEVPKLARFAFNELSAVCKGNKAVLAKNPPRVSLIKRQYRYLRLYDLEWMFSFNDVTEFDSTVADFRSKLKKAESFKFKGIMKQDYKDLNLLYTDGEEKSGLELLIASHDYSEQIGYPMYQCWLPWQSYAIFVGFEDFAKEIQRLLLINSLDESAWYPEKKDPQPIDLHKPELEMKAQGHNRTSYMVQFAYTSFDELNGLLADTVLTVDKLLLGVNRQRINESYSFVFSVFRSISHDRGRANQVKADLFPKIKTTFFGARRDNVNFDFGLEAWFIMAQSYALYTRFSLLYLPLLTRILNVLKQDYKPKEVNFTEMIIKAAYKRAAENKAVQKDSDISEGHYTSNEEVVKSWLATLDQIELDDDVIHLNDARDLLKEMYELAAEDGILALGKQQLLTEHIYNAYKVLSESLPGDSEEAQKARSEFQQATVFREGWYALVAKENRQLVDYIGNLYMRKKPEVTKMDLKVIIESYEKLRKLVQQHQAIANRLAPIVQEEASWLKSKDPEKLHQYWKKARSIRRQSLENVYQQYEIAVKSQIKVAKKEKTEAVKDQFMYNAYRNLYFLQMERKLDPGQFKAEEWTTSNALREVKEFLFTHLPQIFSNMPEDRAIWMNAFTELQRSIILARESKASREAKQTLDRVRDLVNDILRQIALANGRFASSSELDWDQLASLIGIRNRKRAQRKEFQDEETKDEVQLKLTEIEEPDDVDIDEDLEEDGVDVTDTDYAPMVDEDNLQKPDFINHTKQFIMNELPPVKGSNKAPLLPMIQRKQNNNNNVNRADSLPKLEDISNNNNSLSLVPFVSTITENKTPDDEVARLIREVDLPALTSLARSNRQGSRAAEAWLADNYPMALENNNNNNSSSSNSYFTAEEAAEMNALLSDDIEPSSNNNNQMID